MQIAVFQHVPYEGPGFIGKWAKAFSHGLTFTRFFQNEPLPSVDRIDALIVLGGPMSVHETSVYPWLKAGLLFIEKMIQSGKPVLGICLGAQLIAHVLGASVYKNKDKEMGWFPVQIKPEAKTSPFFNSFPQKCTVFHWHGETFSIPNGALHFAESEACSNQGFVYESHVLAMQFHMETDPKAVELLIAHCGHELSQGKSIQTKTQLIQGSRIFPKSMHPLLSDLLNLWIKTEKEEANETEYCLL